MEAEGLFTVSLAGGRELAAFLGFSAAKLGTHGLQLFLDGVGGETYGVVVSQSVAVVSLARRIQINSPAPPSVKCFVRCEFERTGVLQFQASR